MKVLNKVFLIVIVLIGGQISNGLIAQSGVDCNYQRPLQASQWVFGTNLQLDFLDDPTVVNNAVTPEMPIGISAISDEDGNLLFYTNGEKVWNKHMQLMRYGTGLYGNDFSTQSSIVIPHPGKNNRYFLFTADLFYPTNNNHGVNYSVVDVSATTDGSVVSKNLPLLKENVAKLAAVKHSNGHDYWVITHGYGPQNGDIFYSYLVDSSGVHETAVTTQVGRFYQGLNTPDGGYLKCSSDGSMLAMAMTYDGTVDLYDFDNETGLLSNLRTSADNQFVFPYGLEFSPDNSLLYLTTSPLNLNTSFLYQFDLNSPDPFANPFVVKQFDINYVLGADSSFAALQLGIDGKIYVAKGRSSQGIMKNIGVVYNPDRALEDCNYNHLDHADNNGLYSNSGGCQAGLPNFASNFLNIPHFYFLDQCHHDTTRFLIRNTANIDATKWEFNDTDGEQISMDPNQPTFVFSEADDYQISLTETFNGVDYTFQNSVRIHPLPAVEIGLGYDTIYILPNSSIRLDAGPYDYYTWLPDGSTERYLDVIAEGAYAVAVTDSNCCSNTDEVYIKYATLKYPTAFRPSSTVSVNTTFKLVGQISALAKYSLQIYNRWGQLIFESEDPTEGWDGTHKGELVPFGTYVWVSVHESFESGKQGSVTLDSRGTVVLLR